MIQEAEPEDFPVLYEIINDAASAYKGVIPADRWHEPYMPESELRGQIEEGVKFWKYFENGEILGVMGIQDKVQVSLIRHAYVRTNKRGSGIGTKLLDFLCGNQKKPVLIGTWKAATWAVSFYQKNGFSLVSEEEKNRLLKKFWAVPERQIETSVVLADKKWFNQAKGPGVPI